MEDLKKIQEFFSKPLGEGTFDQGEIAIYMGNDDSGTTHIFKRGKGYYGYNDEFDFEAASKEELQQMLDKWGYELLAGSLEESVNEAQFTDYSNNELAAYAKELSKQRADAASKGQNDLVSGINKEIEAATRELKKRSQALKNLSRTDMNELDAATYRSALEKGRSRGDSKGRGLATNALNLLAKKVAQTLSGQSFEVAGSRENLAKGFYRGNSQKFINQFLMTFTGEGSLINPSKLDTVGSDEVHFNMKVEFQNPDNIGGWSSDVKFRGYEKYKFPGTVQFSIKEGNVWVWYNAADTDLEFTRVGARAIAKLADMVAQELQLKTPVKHNSIKQFDPMKPSVEESKKLTFNDFVRMVRDDMMAGAAPDERPSEELVGKRAKAYYNEYLQGASIDDLFEATKEEETEFHTKLDKLVHDTFGKRKGEMEEAELDEKMLVPKDKIDRMARDIAAKFFTSKADKGEAIEILKQAVRDVYKNLDPNAEIQEAEGYSKFLKDDPEHPGGKTKGLTPDVMNKILMKIVQDIKESRPGLWDNIRAKKERGEKPSSKNSKAYKDAVKAGKEINKAKK